MAGRTASFNFMPTDDIDLIGDSGGPQDLIADDTFFEMSRSATMTEADMPRPKKQRFAGLKQKYQDYKTKK